MISNRHITRQCDLFNVGQCGQAGMNTYRSVHTSFDEPTRIFSTYTMTSLWWYFFPLGGPGEGSQQSLNKNNFHTSLIYFLLFLIRITLNMWYGIRALQTLTTLLTWHPPKILGILGHPYKIWVNSVLFNATSNNLCEWFSPKMYMYPASMTSKCSDNTSKIDID